MEGKRGLNQIISMALLILLAIIAMIVIWFFTRAEIVDTGKNIQTECVLLDLKPVECVLKNYGSEFPAGCDVPNWVGFSNWYGDNFTGDSDLVQVKVRRGVGSQDSVLDRVKVFLELENGTVLLKEADITPDALETELSIPPFDLRSDSDAEDVEEVRVAGVIELSDGRKYTCDVSGINSNCFRGNVINPTQEGEDSLNEFWDLGGVGRWTLDATRDVIVSTDNSQTTILNLQGDFVIEQGWNIESSDTFAIIIRDGSNFIQFEWSAALLWAIDSLGGSATQQAIPGSKIDVRLSRAGDNFWWEYQFVANPGWTLLRNDTFPGLIGNNPEFVFDEGVDQELRYVKMQDNGGFPCS